jgi:acyl-CoA synthetase (AMP-forming)/AMP-acid ligase II
MFVDAKIGDLTELASGRSWTGIELAARLSARCVAYRDQGMQPGDRVFILYGNKLEFFVDLLALWYVGASVVPVDGRLTPFEVDNMVRTVTPRFALIDGTVPSNIVAVLSAQGVTVLDAGALDFITPSRTPSSALQCAARLDDQALILFTSGTTGVPKGVVHTHRSLRARWLSLRQCLGVESYERTLCMLPTHFGHGLICNSLYPWLSGQQLFIAPAFSSEILLQLGRIVDQHQITFLSSVPSMWGLTLKGSKPPQAKTLRRIHCGSAPLSAYLWNQIRDWSGTREVYNAYGITETGSWVAGTSIGEFTPQDGLVGAPWGSVIKILKSAERSAPFEADSQCNVDDTGYVWLNTPALMQGYYHHPELTEQVVSGGWFVTGDMGLIDRRGWFYLKGRERDEINKGGTKIYPADIDAVVERFEHTETVCSFAFADSLYGQNVAMAVVLRRQDAATIRQLYTWMKTHLAEFKMPQRWYVVDALPQNSRGKISRNVVQELCTPLKPVDLAGILKSGS